MGYKSAVATYHRLREQHNGNLEARAMIAQFGLELAWEELQMCYTHLPLLAS